MAHLVFQRDFVPGHGRAVAVASGVRRVTAANPGPFTFTGTNSYIVGTGRVAVIDPGPDDPAHTAALLAATAGETVTDILLTHTHRDHSGGAQALANATGAPMRAARRRAIRADEVVLDAGSDAGFAPDAILADGAAIAGDDWRLEAIATPGHASDHLTFALSGAGILFSGDHVMGWSTTVVAPPDGSMRDYMRSLDRLLARPEQIYLPGHGGPITSARAFVAALKAHRTAREDAILRQLEAGAWTVAALVEAVYPALDPRLTQAAGLSVLAHLEDMAERGVVTFDGGGNYRINRPQSS